MKKLLLFLLLTLFPLTASADFASGFQATSTTQGSIFPSKINGTFPYLQIPYLQATSTASSTFAGGIDAPRICLKGTTVCLSSTFGTGTVSSVGVSGGTTGLTTSGGPITTSGTITLAGTLSVANGGTGVTSFSQGWLHSDGLTITSSTSPTVNYIVATSTTGFNTFASRIGIASTSPGTLLAIGASNGINITPTATSTFTKAIQATCFTVDGSTCISGAGGGGSGTVNSGLQGQVAYYDTNGTAVSGTSTLFITQAQRVIVGTTTAVAATTLTVATPLGSSSIDFPFQVIGQDRSALLSVRNTGRVGINTASPGSTLDVAGSINATSYQLNTNSVFSESSGFLVLAVGQTNGSQSDYVTAGPLDQIKSSTLFSLANTTGTVAAKFWGASGQTADIFRVSPYGGATDYVVVQADGDTGIGTSSPYSKLSVVGQVVAANFLATSSATSTINNGFAVGSTTNPQMTFNPNISQAMLSIGSTTPTGKVVIHTVAADTLTNLFIIASSTNAATSTHFLVTNTGAIFAPNTTSSGSSQTGYWCYDTNGQLIRDSAVCLVSAKKYKKDIHDLSLGLDDLMKMRPVTYYKKEPLDKQDSYMQMGFIADEVADIPELDEMLVVRDNKGEIRGFRYDQYAALTTKAIQELNDKVDQKTTSYWPLLGLLGLLGLKKRK